MGTYYVPSAGQIAGQDQHSPDIKKLIRSQEGQRLNRAPERQGAGIPR